MWPSIVTDSRCPAFRHPAPLVPVARGATLHREIEYARPAPRTAAPAVDDHHHWIGEAVLPPTADVRGAIVAEILPQTAGAAGVVGIQREAVRQSEGEPARATADQTDEVAIPAATEEAALVVATAADATIGKRHVRRRSVFRDDSQTASTVVCVCESRRVWNLVLGGPRVRPPLRSSPSNHAGLRIRLVRIRFLVGGDLCESFLVRGEPEQTGPQQKLAQR